MFLTKLRVRKAFKKDDAVWYYLTQPLVFNSERKRIIVPKDTITDFASTPNGFIGYLNLKVVSIPKVQLYTTIYTHQGKLKGLKMI